MVPHLHDEEYAHLTTVGRTSGRPHTVEIWFAAAEGSIYLISGGRERSDWVRNLLAEPRASIRLGGQPFAVTARPDLRDPQERRLAARMLHAKYGAQTSNTAEAWEREAYLVALDPAPA